MYGGEALAQRHPLAQTIYDVADELRALALRRLRFAADPYQGRPRRSMVPSGHSSRRHKATRMGNCHVTFPDG